MRFRKMKCWTQPTQWAATLAGGETMQLPDFLTEIDGEIVLRGHRIGLFHVVNRYRDGFSAEMIVRQYPTLSLALIHKAIAFYLENRNEVDAYVRECAAKMDELRHNGQGRVDFAALRVRLAEL